MLDYQQSEPGRQSEEGSATSHNWVIRLPETSCLFGLENIYSQSQTCTHGLPGRRLLLKHIGGEAGGGEWIDERNIKEAPPQRAPK